MSDVARSGRTVYTIIKLRKENLNPLMKLTIKMIKQVESCRQMEEFKRKMVMKINSKSYSVRVNW